MGNQLVSLEKTKMEISFIELVNYLFFILWQMKETKGDLIKELNHHFNERMLLELFKSDLKENRIERELVITDYPNFPFPEETYFKKEEKVWKPGKDKILRFLSHDILENKDFYRCNGYFVCFSENAFFFLIFHTFIKIRKEGDNETEKKIVKIIKKERIKDFVLIKWIREIIS